VDTPTVSRRLILLDHLTFAQEHSLSVVDGMDLDCRVSDDTDAEGCFQTDFISADGAQGIDNGFSALLPTLTSIVGSDLVETQLEASEDARDLPVLSLYELEDGTLDVSLVRASTTDGASVARDATGQALPMQTLRLDESSAQWLGRARPLGTQLVLRGGALYLPLQLPDDHGERVYIVSPVVEVGASLDLADASTSQAVFTGAISVDELMRITRLLGLNRYADVIHGSYVSAADLGPDASGQCAYVSFGLVFDPVDIAAR